MDALAGRVEVVMTVVAGVGEEEAEVVIVAGLDEEEEAALPAAVDFEAWICPLVLC